MLLAQYAHRLPADYDTGIIRARAKERGPLWDDLPDLHFKAFLLRESGRHGALENTYSSLYLWRRDEAFGSFLVDGRFKTVTDSFGRPRIETRFALDAARGPARIARFVYKEELAVSPDMDLQTVFKAEIERNRQTAAESHVVSAAVGVDAQQWKLTRVVVSEREPVATGKAIAYEVLHFATPLLHELESASR
ncbi:DUF4865 family protein [Caballeronia sp. LP006]|uniref:DUF4865 family protein n=1 Tax=unclassified Caballeronia TaxID=2646786 RepID=UPI002028FFE5|nr:MULTISPECIES: DUF4865 family protein [unclassified Caballeronia]MDR5799841.1 DUF4865 family protein [Caballeronia sp. LZ001]MDR5828011.1 DUF4865 family protein [Caballeronia sp. LP006]